MTTEQLLEAKKDELVRSLMQKAPLELQDLMDTMESLFSIRLRRLQPQTNEYSGYRIAIDAVLEHLRKVGEPMTRPDLISAVVAGGFGPKDDKREINIRAGIRYAINTSKKLVMVDEKHVGLPEWKES